jgi:hypothetical protein
MLKKIIMLTVLVLGLASHASVAWAVTAEVAKKCQVLMSAKFPPRVPGNPAAGSARGSGSEQQDYFKKCVANGGQPPDGDQQKSAK